MFGAACNNGIGRGWLWLALVAAHLSAPWQDLAAAPVQQQPEPAEPLRICASAAGAEPFAVRGRALITFDDIQVYLDRILEEHRSTFLTDPERIGKMLQNLAMPRQLAALALDEGLHERQAIQARMLQGLVTLLADEYVADYADRHLLDDYEPMAREAYMRSDRKSRKRFSFSQILIRVDGQEREPLEAMREIVSVADRLAKAPEKFDELAMQVSADPALSDNQGRYRELEPAELVDTIAEALNGMEAGEISSPVRSPYGWHILRLDQTHESEPVPFDQVRDEFIQRAVKDHRDLIQGRLLSGLAEQDLEIREGVVKELLDRYNSAFGVFGAASQ